LRAAAVALDTEVVKSLLSLAFLGFFGVFSPELADWLSAAKAAHRNNHRSSESEAVFKPLGCAQRSPTAKNAGTEGLILSIYKQILVSQIMKPSRRSREPQGEPWAKLIARGYALALAAVGIAALTVTAWSAVFLYDYALVTSELIGTQDHYLRALTLSLQASTTLLLFGAGVVALFLASGMWRYREWARHGLLVLAFSSIPVLCAAPLVNWVVGLAMNEATFAIERVSTPLVALGVFASLGTVYLFAYRFEIISLYLPRPHLAKKGKSYGYVPLPQFDRRK
jgi:hypothetical protein